MKDFATNFGVAQKRERVFVLGARASTPVRPEATHSLVPAAEAQITPSVGEVLAQVNASPEPEEVVRGRWADHLREIPPGWNYKWHTSWAGHLSPTWEAETRFWNFLLKLDPTMPSWTLPASPGPWVGPFHWDSRRLRTGEYAAIQGFPFGYEFVGDRRSRIRQIGNAVPAPLAQAMVGSVLDAVKAVASVWKSITA